MPDNFVADEEVMIIAGCGVDALSGLQILANSVCRPDKRSASGNFALFLPDAAWTPYPAYKSLRTQYVGLISVAHQAILRCSCRMRRGRLIRPTNSCELSM